MSSIMKGIMKEEENVVVLYIDGRATTKYPAMTDAKDDVERLKKKFPNKKIELKREVRGGHGGNEQISEGKNDPCWKGYKQVGMKKKGGKEVPNCVPVKEEQIDEVSTKTIKSFIPKANQDARENLKNGNTDKAKKGASGIELGIEKIKGKKGLPNKAKIPANETAFEADLEDHEPRIVTGIYGVKSKEFRKKFANQKAQDRFFDNPDNQGNYEIYQVKRANISESVIISTTQNGNPRNPQVAVLGGAGSYSYENLKKKAAIEARQLAQDIENGEYRNSSINVKQLANTLNTIVAAEDELEKMYFGEDLSEQSGVKYPVRSMDGVEKAFSDPNGYAARNWAASYAKKAKSTSYAPAKPKKPTLDAIWSHVEHSISNYFPDGDPTDYLGPYMKETGITWNDITRACKKQGYKDLWDYWNTLAQDIENDAYGDWVVAKRPEPPVNPLSRDAADIQHRDWVAKNNPQIRTRAPFMENEGEEQSSINNEGKIKGKDGKTCWKGYRYAGTEDGKDKCVPVKKTAESSIMKGLKRK